MSTQTQTPMDDKKDRSGDENIDLPNNNKININDTDTINQPSDPDPDPDPDTDDNDDDDDDDEYLHYDNNQLKNIISELKQKLRNAINSKQELSSKIHKKDIELNEYKNELKQMKKQINDIDKYKEQINKLKLENETLSTTKNQLFQTRQLEFEHAKRLETDYKDQMSSHTQRQQHFKKLSQTLKERLEHSLSEIRHLTTLNDQHQLEIQSLTTRNEQISTISQETIDDLSKELAEEKDGHSNYKHKYGKLKDEFTKLKIKYEKRGTNIDNIKKDLQKKELKLLSYTANDKSNPNNKKLNLNDPSNKQAISLLYRQIENYKNEINGTTQHLEHCKTYLNQTLNYLEQSALLNVIDDIDHIYGLCKDSRQFLGIDEPPPDPTPMDDQFQEPTPPMPAEPSPDALPNDVDNDIPLNLPKERTPPVPQININTTPSIPKTLPSTPTKPSKPKMPSLPSMPEEPSPAPSPSPSPQAQPQPQPPPRPQPPQQPKPQPPRPKSIKYSDANMPQFGTIPSMPSIPSQPNYNDNIDKPPSMPTDPDPDPKPIPVQPKSKPIPKKKKIRKKMVHNIATMPQAVLPSMPEGPSASPSPPPPQLPPPHPQSQPKSIQYSNANMPASIPSMPYIPPQPNDNDDINKPPMPTDPDPDPDPQSIQPKPKKKSKKLKPKKKKKRKKMIHNTANMPQPVLPIPTMPDDDDIAPTLPPQPSDDYNNLKSKINNAAMKPKPVRVRPMPPPTPSDRNKRKQKLPTPTDRDDNKMMEQKSSVSSYNNVPPVPPKLDKKKSLKSATKKKPRKRTVKKEKKGHSIEDQKNALKLFFTRYSDSKNWKEGDKERGVQKYILHFASREPLNARMAFLYSMTLYLGQIVGVNKRCITHAFMLFKSVRAQIDTLSEEFSLILQTLEYHKDDKLWKYVYSFLYNAAAYFKHIQKFVGTRTSVANPKAYTKKLRASSSTDRRESTQFRKLSGLSDISNQSYDRNNSISNTHKKKKKSSYGTTT